MLCPMFLRGEEAPEYVKARKSLQAWREVRGKGEQTEAYSSRRFYHPLRSAVVRSVSYLTTFEYNGVSKNIEKGLSNSGFAPLGVHLHLRSVRKYLSFRKTLKTHWFPSAFSCGVLDCLLVLKKQQSVLLVF